MTAARDNDDEHAHGAEPNELDAIEHGGLVRRAHRKSDAARRLREHVRDLRQQRIQQAVGTLAPEPRLDRRGRAQRTPRFEQQVDVETIAAVGWNSARRSMRLLDVALFFEARKNAADRGGRHAKTGRGHKYGRGDRFARRDVFANERGEDSFVSICGVL